MNKEFMLKYKWWLIGILVIVAFLGYWFFVRATYPDIYTPKLMAGNPNATVTITEFSDFQCPACGSAYTVVEQIMEEYSDKVRLEYKHFPLTSIHTYAFKAAEASECANDQGKFWEYVDILFTHQNELTNGDLKNYAVSLGLDENLFNNCLDSDAKKKYVTADYNEGVGKIKGTPTFFINGQKLESWKYENFKSALDAALNGK
ncbi:MAG: thioredoxin domain-containing protein [Candidatus Woesearchaeota archaeon]|jgi:protein-disulfide isomerase